MWSVYGGYNGSHQSYDGVSIYQNGGTLGAVGMAYKGNFFTGLTANVDRTHFTANDVSLPNLSIDPFVKYGVGIRKAWGERFTGFLQTYITNGGRNGVGIQAGFRWTLGKTQPSVKKASGNLPELPKTEIILNNIK